MTDQQHQYTHPRSLSIFFATEMWERYGFYVVQTLLALYLANYFQWADKKVFPLVGTFTAIAYLSPVLGGLIADHLLGQKKAVLIGALFLFFSYVSLYIFTSELGLISSLAGIAVGTGLLKPNISSLLGNEYPEHSPKRESGFTIFYIGITTGIILGSTLPDLINHQFGWAGSFASAAIGMIIATVVFLYGITRFNIADYHESEFCIINLIKALALMFLLWAMSICILKYNNFANIAFALVVCASAGYLIHTIRNEPAEQSRQTLVIGLLCVISVVFWAFYFQMFLSLTLFLSRVVEHDLFGTHFPAPYYVTVQSVGMIVFGYMLSRGHNQPPRTIAQSGILTANKFLLSIVLMTFAYIAITIISYSNPGEILLAPLYFIPAYLIISVAELLLSPVGLSAITVLACRKKVSTMMGIFFVSLGLGAFLAGKLALISAVTADDLTVAQLKEHYAHAFSNILYILLAAAGVCYAINRAIRNLLQQDS